MSILDLTAAATSALLAVGPTLQRLIENPSPSAWLSTYQSADPLTTAVIGALGMGVFCYVAQVLSGNCSWVDKLWSLVPWWYVIHFTVQPALASGFTHWNARAVVMTVCSVCWGLRLSYNFYRKDGYTWAGEDYRWPELRTKHITNPVLWHLFSFGFIAMYQNLLLLSFVVPVWACVKSSPVSTVASLTTADWVLAGAWFLVLIIETVADQQQWNFQTSKYAYIKKHGVDSLAGTEWSRGFVESGLWRYSRHPNFCCEVTLWYIFYSFSVVASASAASGTGSVVYLNVSLIGAILLNLLFHGSTNFTESITSKKYPAYKEYQQTTSRILPWFSSAKPKDQ